MVARLTIGAAAGQPCELEVGDYDIAVAVTQGAAGTLRATVRASGPASTISETIVLVGVDSHAPRSVRLIVDRIQAILALGNIEPSRFAPGSLIDAATRGGRPRRAADSLFHALAWAAVGVLQLAGPTESRPRQSLVCEGCQSRGQGQG